jgi:hypothetical protein
VRQELIKTKKMRIYAENTLNIYYPHHYQPIYVPTAGAQAFLMDYTLGERAIIHHAGPVQDGGC